MRLLFAHFYCVRKLTYSNAEMITFRTTYVQLKTFNSNFLQFSLDKLCKMHEGAYFKEKHI